MKILIVEDDRNLSHAIKRCLPLPYDSDQAFDGAEGYFLASKGIYDLIILDPPAFAKHHKVLGNAMQGYKRLNARAISQIRPGQGILQNRRNC